MSGKEKPEKKANLVKILCPTCNGKLTGGIYPSDCQNCDGRGFVYDTMENAMRIGDSRGKRK